MRLFRNILLIGLAAILGVAIYQTGLWLGLWGSVNASQVKALKGNDQEIALIEPATSTDDWGRLVTALQLVERDWPRINPTLPLLQINTKGAFPTLSADVPEIVLWFPAVDKAKLRLRWYKISGEHDAASWIAKLRARQRPPLAVIGGGTSDRAVRLARALQETYPDPESRSPALIITTATAENTDDDKLLIKEYDKRSFRFSFTNQRMVDALLKFVRQTPDLWVSKAVPSDKGHEMYAFSWEDERYSKDLFELFEKRYALGEFFGVGAIPYAVGDFFRPSPLEQDAIGTFLARLSPIRPQSFLVLPTQSVRMRRFLINLRQRAPQDARNLVILNGDSISFNAVYRDRDVLWNIFDLPYSLVFFAHRNPIDPSAGFVKMDSDESFDSFPQRSTTSTHDILLYRDIFEALLYAACDSGTLLGDPLEVRARLRATAWHRPPPDKGQEQPRVCNMRVHELTPEPRRFFSKLGDRRRETGEHIVWVKPSFIDDRVDRTSNISVWSMAPSPNGEVVWKEDRALSVEYNKNP